MALSKGVKSTSDSGCNVQAVDGYPDFQNLPDPALMQIFDYLNSRDLRRVACVCKKWNKAAVESPKWKRFDSYGMDLNESTLFKVLRKIPFYVTHMRIMMKECNIIVGVSFPELSEIIFRRCKKLEELYFENCFLCEFNISKLFDEYHRRFVFRFHMTEPPQSFFANPLIFLPHSLRLLSFRRVGLSTPSLLLRIVSQKILPNLEVLDLSTRLLDTIGHGPPAICDFKNLKELHLPLTVFDTKLDSYVRCFRNLKVLNLKCAEFKRGELSKLHGYVINLEELYLCKVPLRDEHLEFINEETFPKLKLICIKISDVSKEVLKSLFHFCKSLKTVVSNIRDESDQVRYGYYEFRKKDLFFNPISDCSTVHCKRKYHINSIKKY